MRAAGAGADRGAAAGDLAAVAAGLAAFELPNRGSGAGPGGSSRGPFMPQAARPIVSKTAAIRVIGDDAVSKEQDGSTRWMTRNSTAWQMQH